MCSRQDIAASLTGAGEVISYGGIDVRLAYELPGKPAEEHGPSLPLDELSGRDVVL